MACGCLCRSSFETAIYKGDVQAALAHLAEDPIGVARQHFHQGNTLWHLAADSGHVPLMEALAERLRDVWPAAAAANAHHHNHRNGHPQRHNRHTQRWSPQPQAHLQSHQVVQPGQPQQQHQHQQRPGSSPPLSGDPGVYQQPAAVGLGQSTQGLVPAGPVTSGSAAGDVSIRGDAVAGAGAEADSPMPSPSAGGGGSGGGGNDTPTPAASPNGAAAASGGSAPVGNFQRRSNPFQRISDNLRGRAPDPSQQPLAAFVSASNALGHTPLMVACQRGHDGCVKLLLSLGANPWGRDRGNCTALHHAALRNHAACIDVILQHASSARPPAGTRQALVRLVDLPNFCGYTPLHFATACGRPAAMGALLAGGANIAARCWSEGIDWISGPRGSTPLHFAAKRGDVDMCKMILRHYFEVLRDTGVVDPRLHTDVRGMRPCQLLTGRWARELVVVLSPQTPLAVIFQDSDFSRLYRVPKLKAIAAASLQAALLEQIDQAEAEVVLRRVRLAGMAAAAAADAVGAADGGGAGGADGGTVVSRASSLVATVSGAFQTMHRQSMRSVRTLTGRVRQRLGSRKALRDTRTQESGVHFTTLSDVARATGGGAGGDGGGGGGGGGGNTNYSIATGTTQGGWSGYGIHGTSGYSGYTPPALPSRTMSNMPLGSTADGVGGSSYRQQVHATAAPTASDGADNGRTAGALISAAAAATGSDATSYTVVPYQFGADWPRTVSTTSVGTALESAVPTMGADRVLDTPTALPGGVSPVRGTSFNGMHGNEAGSILAASGTAAGPPAAILLPPPTCLGLPPTGSYVTANGNATAPQKRPEQPQTQSRVGAHVALSSLALIHFQQDPLSRSSPALGMAQGSSPPPRGASPPPRGSSPPPRGSSPPPRGSSPPPTFDGRGDIGKGLPNGRSSPRTYRSSVPCTALGLETVDEREPADGGGAAAAGGAATDSAAVMAAAAVGSGAAASTQHRKSSSLASTASEVEPPRALRSPPLPEQRGSLATGPDPPDAPASGLPPPQSVKPLDYSGHAPPGPPRGGVSGNSADGVLPYRPSVGGTSSATGTAPPRSAAGDTTQAARGSEFGSSVAGSGLLNDPAGGSPRSGLQAAFAMLTGRRSREYATTANSGGGGVGGVVSGIMMSVTRRGSGRVPTNGSRPGSGTAVAGFGGGGGDIMALGSDTEEEVCGICFERAAYVHIKPCNHLLCAVCSREVTRLVEVRAPLCPFCRGVVRGFRVR